MSLVCFIHYEYKKICFLLALQRILFIISYPAGFLTIIILTLIKIQLECESRKSRQLLSSDESSDDIDDILSDNDVEEEKIEEAKKDIFQDLEYSQMLIEY